MTSYDEEQPQGPTHLGSGHTPLGGAVHEGGDGEAAAALLVPLAEELLLQLVGPSFVRARRRRQVPNVSTLQHHLRTCNMPLECCTALQLSRINSSSSCKALSGIVEYVQHTRKSFLFSLLHSHYILL